MSFENFKTNSNPNVRLSWFKGSLETLKRINETHGKTRVFQIWNFWIKSSNKINCSYVVGLSNEFFGQFGDFRIEDATKCRVQANRLDENRFGWTLYQVQTRTTRSPAATDAVRRFNGSIQNLATAAAARMLNGIWKMDKNICFYLLIARPFDARTVLGQKNSEAKLSDCQGAFRMRFQKWHFKTL